MNALGAVLGLAGGLGLFLYGMQMCSEGLQKMAAQRLKQLVRALTRNPLLGLLVGTAATLGLQSSSATSALVVGFVGAGMMSLSQALGVLLGSAIGASLTMQLIAFKITSLAMALLFIGAALYLFAKRSRQRSLGQATLGFGLIFFGMSVMTSAMAPLRDYPLVAQALIALQRYPVLEFLVALAGTAVIQSSTAFLALLMSLAAHGLIGPLAIIPFVLGAHLGGTVTGVVSSLGAPGREAKRAALANFGFKLGAGLVFLPFYRPLTVLVLWSSGGVGRQIANAHTLFSLAMAIGFLPLDAGIARLLTRLIPEKRPGLGEAVYLDESLLELPELAVDQSHRQTVEMGRIIQEEILDRLLPVLQYGSVETIDALVEAERATDSLYKQISHYVTSLGNNRLSDDLMQRGIQTLYAANDLEHIGDIAMSVVQIARKIHAEDLEFSSEGTEEIRAMFDQVYSRFALALKAYEAADAALATRVIKEHPRIVRFEKELRYSHFDRMQSGNRKTVATSSIHLDLIEALLRLDGHAVNIAQGVMGII